MVGGGVEIREIGRATLSFDGMLNWGDNTVAMGDSAPTTSTTRLASVSGKLSYPIAAKQDVFVSAETAQNSGDALATHRQVATLGWNYRFSQSLTLTAGASRTEYRDQRNANLNYRADSLDAKMGWRF
jgi:hypothetical protein